MALSRNARRLNAKRRKALAEADKLNTATFIAKQALIQSNCKELGKLANRTGNGGISWLSPTAKPLGYRRRLIFSQGVAK